MQVFILTVSSLLLPVWASWPHKELCHLKRYTSKVKFNSITMKIHQASSVTTNNTFNNSNNNNNDNNLYSKRVTQSNGKDLPWGPLACLQVDRGPQGYKVVEYIAFRYRDLKVEMVHIWLLQLSHSKRWVLSMKCILSRSIYYNLEELIAETWINRPLC